MELKILDTGYYNTNKTGTQESLENRAGYDGSSTVLSLPLSNVDSIDLGYKQNISPTPSVSLDPEYEPIVGNTESGKISFKMRVNRDSLPSGYDINYLYQIIRLSWTKTVKVLYADGDGLFHTTIGYLAEKYKNGAFSDGIILPSNTPYLPVMVDSVKLEDNFKGSSIIVSFVMTIVGDNWLWF